MELIIGTIAVTTVILILNNGSKKRYKKDIIEQDGKAFYRVKGTKRCYESKDGDTLIDGRRHR